MNERADRRMRLCLTSRSFICMWRLMFFKERIREIDVAALVAAFLIAVCFVVGLQVYHSVYLNESLIQGVGSIVFCIIVMSLLVLALYVLIVCVFTWVDAHSGKSLDEDEVRGRSPFSCVLKANLLRYSLIVLVCWLPVMLIRFPGNIDPDTFWQLLQTRGLALTSDHHPWFDTVLFGLFWSIGDVFGSHAFSLLAYSVSQAVLTAISFAVCFCYFRWLEVHSILRRGIVALVSLLPFFPMFAQTMAKDTLFAAVWVLFLLFYFETVRTKGEVLKNFRVVAGGFLLLGLIVLTKKTGIYLLALSLVPLILICRANKARLLLLTGSVVCLFFVWTNIALPAWGVVKGSSAEMMSIPSQQVGYYLSRYSDEVTQDDWRVLEGVYASPEVLGTVYQPARADATKMYWKGSSTTETKIEFLSWYFRTALKHPKTFLDGALATMLPLFYPDGVTEGDESFIFYRDNLASAATGDPGLVGAIQSYSGGSASASDMDSLFAGSFRIPVVARISDIFDNLYLKIAELVPLLFHKVTYALYIPIIVLCYCMSRARMTTERSPLEVLLSFAPVIAVYLSLLAGPIALPRYMATSVYATPLLLALPWVLGMANSGKSGHDDEVADAEAKLIFRMVDPGLSENVGE